MRTSWHTLAFLAAAAGCVDTPELGIDPGEVAGTPTTARPEVGRVLRDGITPCMATLVAPRLVVTDDGCALGHEASAPAPLRGARFEFTDATGQVRTVGIDRAVAWQRVSLVHLAAPVAATQATPAAISTLRIDDGAPMTVFTTDPATDLKQALGYLAPSPISWDQVDRGGPHFHGELAEHGDLAATSDRYTYDDQIAFTDEPTLSDAEPLADYWRQFEAELHAWDGDDEVGFDRPGTDYASTAGATAASCRALCENDARCLAFTLTPAGVCWRKTGRPALRPAAGMVSGLPRTSRVGVDVAGAVIATSTTSRADLCEATCARDTRCRAWTWFPFDASCRLKSNRGALLANADVTSGIVDHDYEQFVDRPGRDYASDPTPGHVACATLCAGDEQCAAWTWDVISGRCWRKRDVPGAVASDRAISGVRRGVEVDTDRTGGDYRSFVLGNNTQRRHDLARATRCQAACAREAQCRAWAISERDATETRCYLKSTLTPRSFKQGCLSGVKGLEFQ